jgi:hypothetical protein
MIGGGDHPIAAKYVGSTLYINIVYARAGNAGIFIEKIVG